MLRSFAVGGVFTCFLFRSSAQPGRDEVSGNGGCFAGKKTFHCQIKCFQMLKRCVFQANPIKTNSSL